VVMSVPVDSWPAYGVVLCWVLAGLSLAEVPASYWLRRVRLLCPALLGLALAVPVSQGFRSGWESAVGIILRGLCCFLSALWLASTTPLEQVLAALRRMGVPRLLIDQLAFTSRYLSVITEELSRLQVARDSRTLTRPGVGENWRGASQVLGRLVVRSLDRADRIERAMQARGWTGRMPE
jgi:cobalt/nickel transport system permease protein